MLCRVTHSADRAFVLTTLHRARDFEAHQSLESFARWARRTIGDGTKLEGIASWAALHDALKPFGVRLVPRGNGLAIVDATRSNLACKASALGRRWSKQRLCERYGEFVPGPSSAEVTRDQASPYAELPLRPSRDDSLWREYQDALHAARARRIEQREVLSRKVDAARAAHRRQFKLQHHAIAALPIPAKDKRRHYKALSLQRKAAERKLGATIRHWRTMSVDTRPGSWKQFLAAQAARGDRRASRRLGRQWHGVAITNSEKQVRGLPLRSSRTSRGSVIHNLPGGARLRESARSIVLLGDAHDQALEQLVTVASRRFGSKGVVLLGRKDVRRRLAKVAARHDLEIDQERER